MRDRLLLTRPIPATTLRGAVQGMQHRPIFLAGLLLGCAAVSALLFYMLGAGQQAPYRTAKAERGQLQSTISTTGTLNAVITVQVGTQVSGQIRELSADFNSNVKKGQIIARIDPQTFE